ncbi:TonB-dependent receptor [Larkinella sp. C7]|uniref:SusC/RagA family TonB-linked outer membrane protein n=1 Tax=Larkinella sp. C7 TaxID=2576607 RepID=UPI0011115D18|nr:TonB-dependent receptor [Larkinella sp. C7]
MKQNRYTLSKLLLCLFLQAVSSWQGYTYAQVTASIDNSPVDKKVLATDLHKPLKQALNELSTRYNASVIYNLQTVENKFVTRQTQSPARIEDALQNLLGPLNLHFEKVKEHVYVVVPPKESRKENRPDGIEAARTTSLPLLDNSLFNPLQARMNTMLLARMEQKTAITVRGRVTSDNGEGLVGVNVIIKGSTTGVTTDGEGNYTLTVPNGNGTLIFSYIGFLSKEIPINNRSVINVQLATDERLLSEVQVVGYGTQSKAEVTSAIATVTAKEIKDMPLVGLDQALQGRASGVQVTNNTGAPGGGVSIRIRGTSSLGAGNEPLYVVDGVPINNTQTFNQQTGEERINGMSNINPADIESIEILKDAASTSIYGARAANGVVLITTKRGKAGKQQIDLTSYYGFSKATGRYNVLGASDFAILSNEGLASIKAAPVFTQAFINNPTTNTDWQDAVLRTAPTANINISTRGGTEKTQYMLSAGYMDQQGILIDSRFKRYNLRVNLDQRINKKVKIGNSLMVSYTDNNRLRNNGTPRSDAGGNHLYGSPVLTTALTRSPATPIRLPNGEYSFDPLAPLIANPVAMALAQHLDNKTIRLIGNLFAEWEIIRGLRFRTQLGTDVRFENEDFFYEPFQAAVQGNGTGTGSVRNFNEVLWLTENYLTYDFGLGKDHKFQALLGTSFQESRLEEAFSYVGGFVSKNVTTLNGGSTILTSTSNAESWGIASYFGRLNYNYKSKYLLSINARLDGSSRFGANNKYGFFPSASVGWNLSEEEFMKSSTTISNLKFRASYGITGNQEIGNYSYIGTFGVGGGANTGRNYLNRLGAVANNIPNDDFSWEQTAQFNVGADVGFLNNRLSLTADYYIKTTTDLLLNLPLPRTSGFSSTLTNIGKMENKGFELGINTINLNGAFSWSTNLNFSMNRNKVLSLIGGQDIAVNEATLIREGQPISFWVYEREKNVNPENGTVVIVDQDKSGGAVNSLDRVIMGSPLPKHIGGLTNTFGYKGFDLNIFFQWSYGNKIYNQTRKWMEGLNRDLNSTIGYNTTQVSFDKRWQKPGDVTAYPGVFYDNRSANNLLPHNGWLEDGSYLRLKTLTLGYNLPRSVTSKLQIASARLYFSSNNLLTFTRYSGYDPEVSHFTGSGLGGNVAMGYDYGTFPQPKTYTLGLNISF